ncbi:response regulator receiver protein [Chthoniobacter flavus Ellin428]|uniref:Response regulator receiver protein n=1 Tax=Chthoniobacter flavus Ellin428 TaxID=497964 RepID=B4DBF3_9BACT|nr:hypothetical protein [Chthoniobacter flavus]EDY16243.1 response regulator receiver protein [Chthoniobacter flavus Ellin428]TCO84371.1 hypothetical protein EV701_13620 [Chthoniobacter flavus]
MLFADPALRNQQTRSELLERSLKWERLALLMNQEMDMEACGEAGDAQSALQIIRRNQLDLVVLDISLERLEWERSAQTNQSETPEKLGIRSAGEFQHFATKWIYGNDRAYGEGTGSLGRCLQDCGGLTRNLGRCRTRDVYQVLDRVPECWL